MDQTPIITSPMQPAAPESNKSTIVAIFIIIALVLIAGLSYWLLSTQGTINGESQENALPIVQPMKNTQSDSTAAITRDLESINVDGVNVGKEFTDIDADLQSL